MKIEHIAFWVSDLEAMKEFYIKYFKATAGHKYHNPKKSFTSYFLTFEGGSRFEIMHRTDITTRPNHEFLGIAHLAFSAGSKEKVNELTEMLRNDGYRILSEPRTTGDGYYESVIRDTEGNEIEITV
jgi:lactoylglutathione lyase